MTRTQRLWLVAASVLGFIVFIALTIYYAAAASGHPRVKHMVLFIALAVLSLIVAWFSMPGDTMQSGGRA
jgi:hypothetical protein